MNQVKVNSPLRIIVREHSCTHTEAMCLCHTTSLRRYTAPLMISVLIRTHRNPTYPVLGATLRQNVRATLFGLLQKPVSSQVCIPASTLKQVVLSEYTTL